jgi:hypothetical protein
MLLFIYIFVWIQASYLNNNRDPVVLPTKKYINYYGEAIEGSLNNFPNIADEYFESKCLFANTIKIAILDSGNAKTGYPTPYHYLIGEVKMELFG